MSTPTSSATTSESQGSEISKVAREDRSGVLATGSPSVLQSPQGNTTIADEVVSKIAGLAAREVSGVHALGGGAARAFGSLRDRIPGASTSTGRGVNVEVGETQAAVDLDVVAEYGVSIADLARSIRKNVISSVESMTGLEVVEVNVSVNDIHLPSDDVDDQPHPREPEPVRVL